MHALVSGFAWDSNPGLQSFKASTWHTELSPQLQHRALCRTRFLLLRTYLVVGVGGESHTKKKIVEGWHLGIGISLTDVN